MSRDKGVDELHVRPDGKKKVKLEVDEALLKSALARIEFIKMKQDALAFALRPVDHYGHYNRARSGQEDDMERGHRAISLALHEQLMDAYRDLFMYGLVSPRIARAARKRAYARFMADGEHIRRDHFGGWRDDGNPEDSEVQDYLNGWARAMGIDAPSEEGRKKRKELDKEVARTTPDDKQ